jgi:membrane fusion protein, copper/silver efflux system
MNMRTEQIKTWARYSGLSLLIVLMALGAFALGVWMTVEVVHEHPGADPAAAAAEPTTYTCPMHPQVRTANPDDKCPICFMDLVPVGATDPEDDDPAILRVSERAAKLMQVATAPVVRKHPSARVRMVGTVEYDETREARITAWFPGRLDKLYLEYCCVEVVEGTPLAEIYSPALYAAQVEFVSEVESLERFGEGPARRSGEATVGAARERLRLLGMTPDQIDHLAESREPSERLTFHSPVSGVIVQRDAREGEWVQEGTRIFSIVDMDNLWLVMQAYESDLPWLREGQEFAFRTDAWPGEEFRGRIAFIDPVLSARTRTVRIIANVDNRDRRLKPEMFVRAEVQAVLGADGRAVDPLGNGDHRLEAGATAPLVIPASAPLITGRRAIVYVHDPEADRPTYRFREVVLGPRAGDEYIVRRGLAEGERVVVRGNFMIDSAMQLAQKHSMLTMPEVDPSREPVKAPPEFLHRHSALYDAYFRAQEALADDDFWSFIDAAERIPELAADIRPDGLGPGARDAWEGLSPRIADSAASAVDALDIQQARERFEALADAMILLNARFGHAGDSPHYVANCPMAFDDRGADWLARVEQIANPYFGAVMLRCGTIEETFEPLAGPEESPQRHRGTEDNPRNSMHDDRADSSFEPCRFELPRFLGVSVVHLPGGEA